MTGSTQRSVGVALLFIGILLVIPPAFSAEEEKITEEEKGFALGVGAAYVRFDTNAKFTDKSSGTSVFVDAEGTLGLPETDFAPAVYGAYRFSKKHSLGFSYFQIRRDVTLLDVDLTLEEIRVEGWAELRDRTRFYSLDYGYSFFVDDRSRVQGIFGLYGLDLEYVLFAQGQITEGDETIAGEVEESASVFAPLPLFGLDFWHAFTPKWGVRTRISFVAGSYGDVSAAVLQTVVDARLQFTKKLGAIFGVTYFEADVTIEDSEDRTDITYGYNGAYFGLHIIF